jgi:gliding motility-associated-like protein
LNPSHKFLQPGTFDVSLAILNNQYGCKDTVVKKMTILPKPTATAKGGNICLGEVVQLESSGGLNYQWTPTTGVSFPNDSVTSASPIITTNYSIIVSDINDCKDTAEAFVYVQQKPPVINFDTSVVIGEYIPLITNGGGSFIYTWSPMDSLACQGCENNMSHIMTNFKYNVMMKDTMGCFEGEGFFNIEIRPVSSIDVPEIFTPNGDGINDIVFVEGWGLKRLLYFKIYNRWGELIFESSNITIGWDGTFNGVPQGTEAFAYTAAVETYIDDKPLEKKGFIKLVR